MTPMHLLVVARAAERRAALVAAVRDAGHQAVVAPDAAAAADAIAAPGLDAMVLDLEWPELDLGHLRQSLSAQLSAEPESLDAAERRHIALTLRFTGGNRRRASQLLGISRSTLLHKVRKYGLEDL